ncbi:MAG: YcnI family protein [Chloroflexi bacterium]|nr:YcnI family protein [Chloroflexota bacterium]
MLSRKFVSSRRVVLLALLSAILVSTLLASTASAHVALFETKTIQSNYYGSLKFRVPHGCGHEGVIGATSVFKVEIPEGILIVKPESIAGWNSEVVTGAVAPWDDHGTMSTEGPKWVIWAAEPGNELLDSDYKDFGIHVKLGDEERQPLGVLYIKAYQECIDGDTDSQAWDEIPVPGEDRPASPAPSIMVVPKGSTGLESAIKDAVQTEMTSFDSAIENAVQTEFTSFDSVVEDAVRSEMTSIDAAVNVAVERAMAQNALLEDTDSNSSSALAWLAAAFGVVAVASSAYAVRATRLTRR